MKTKTESAKKQTAEKPKNKKTPVVATSENDAPYLKEYLIERGLSQKTLSQETYLSTGTVHKLVNKGIACRSVILLVAYHLNITYEEMVKMIQTDGNKKYHKLRHIKSKKG